MERRLNINIQDYWINHIYYPFIFRSFGVGLWEVLEFGQRPYHVMSDEEVLQKVIKLRAVGLTTASTEEHKDL